jgi:L-lactate dehydrogenase complex protein LldF
MTQHPTSKHFKDNAHRALQNAQLQKALGHTRTGFIERRAQAASCLPEFDALRDSARDIKSHVLAHLDLYLEAYERQVIA